jgi:nicotinate-nucleotide adenylyltransferase
MKICVLFGSFNPLTNAHITALRTAVNAIGADKGLFVATNGQYLKRKTVKIDDPFYLSEDERKAIIEKVCESESKLEFWGFELGGINPSRFKTLCKIQKQYPDAEMWLLMGTDMFLTLQNWYDPEMICKLAGICAFGRTEQDSEAVFAPQREFLYKKFEARTMTIALPGLVEISSTQIRDMLEQRKGEQYLHQAVYGYILLNGLYGTRADLKQLDIPELRACSYSMVRQKRVPHIRGTEEEAMRLAAHWGADVDAAQRAGILHDCTKYLELDAQLELCRRYGVELDALEQHEKEQTVQVENEGYLFDEGEYTDGYDIYA